MQHHTTGDPAAEIDLPLVHKTPQADREGFFVAGKSTLAGGHPGDFSFRDDAGRQGFQKDLTESHERHVTQLLHDDAGLCRAWVGLPGVRAEEPRCGSEAERKKLGAASGIAIH